MGFVKKGIVRRRTPWPYDKIARRDKRQSRKSRAERHAPGDFASPQAKQQADTQMIPPLTSLGK